MVSKSDALRGIAVASYSRRVRPSPTARIVGSMDRRFDGSSVRWIGGWHGHLGAMAARQKDHSCRTRISAWPCLWRATGTWPRGEFIFIRGPASAWPWHPTTAPPARSRSAGGEREEESAAGAKGTPVVGHGVTSIPPIRREVEGRSAMRKWSAEVPADPTRLRLLPAGTTPCRTGLTPAQEQRLCTAYSTRTLPACVGMLFLG